MGKMEVEMDNLEETIELWKALFLVFFVAWLAGFCWGYLSEQKISDMLQPSPISGSEFDCQHIG